MTSRNLKLLASTAFVAAASVGHAATVTTSGTTTISNESASDFVSGTSTISVTGAPALIISSTTGDYTLGVSSSSVLRSDSVTGTIQLGADSDTSGTVTIINQGSIINTGAGAAISTTEAQVNGQPAIVVTNSGTISGSIENGASALTINNTGTITGAVVNGADDLTYTATGGTQTGNITGTGTGTDAVTLTDSTMTGDISLGGGANGLTVSNSTLTGDYTGTSGVDTVNIQGSSTVYGDLTLGGGADVLNINGSTISGTITTAAASADVITLTNATVSGTIVDGATNDNDTLNINGTNTFTTLGDITGMETVNVNTNTVLNHALVNSNDMNVSTSKVLSANQNFNLGGTLTNDGTVNIAAGKTVTVDGYSSTGGVIGIAVSDSTSAGKLAMTTGTTSNGTSFTINMSDTSGYIAHGTSYTIVAGASGNAGGSLTSTANGLYRYSLVSTSTDTQDLDLIVNRVSMSSVVTGGDNQAIGNVLDNLGASATDELLTLQGTLGSQANAAGVQNVIESLTPSIDGAGTASVNMAVDTGNQVSNRLASVRSNGYGVATGDAMASKHMWVQGFGSTQEQDDKDGARGYDANSAGISMGVDTDTLVDGVTTGLAFTYGKGTVDSNAYGGASTDIDTYAATLYGSRVMDNGIFVNGQLGMGFNQYDMTRTVTSIGRSTGETDGWQGTAKIETGRDYAVGGLTMTPLASLQYTYLDMDSYTETGAGGASLRVNPESMSTVDAGLGGEMSYAMPLSDGGTLKPSVHAKYFYRMGDDSMGTTSQFVGGGAAFSTSGVKSDRSSVNLGAGLLLTTVGGTDLSLNYDADIRSSLTGHTGQLKARWAF